MIYPSPYMVHIDYTIHVHKDRNGSYDKYDFQNDLPPLGCALGQHTLSHRIFELNIYSEILLVGKYGTVFIHNQMPYLGLKGFSLGRR